MKLSKEEREEFINDMMPFGVDTEEMIREYENETEEEMNERLRQLEEDREAYYREHPIDLPKYVTDTHKGIVEYFELGEDDLYYPCQKTPSHPKPEIGLWGERRRTYIKEYNTALYKELKADGELWEYLVTENYRAEEMQEQLTKQMAEKEGVTEKMKAEDQMKWVQMMNNIASRVREIVYNEVIYQ